MRLAPQLFHQGGVIVLRIKGKLLAVGALTLAAFAVAPMAQAEKGDWLFKGGATMVSPKSGNLSLGDLGEVPDLGVSIDNVSIEVDDGTSFGFTITYMMTNNWAVELLAAVPFKHDIKLKATITDLLPPGGSVTDSAKIGDTKHLPPTISLQYHFLPDGMFNPYVGVGFNTTLFSSESLNSDARDLFAALGINDANLKLDTSTGVAAQIGIDWYFGDKWFANADVRYIDLGTKAKITGTDEAGDAVVAELGTVNIDPIVYSLMLGYRF
jgi:outer membrane protein